MISRELPPFETDKPWIRQEFEASHNEEKRKWYYKTFNKEQTSQ